MPMAIERIQVRKKTNPSLTRSIQKAALGTFMKRGWVPVDEAVSVQTTPEVKKKDVESAEVPAKIDAPQDEVSDTPFVPVTDEPEGEKENPVDSLREEFQNLSGKAADKRWSEKRLIEEIAKLK